MITNTAKPTTTLTNASRVISFESWDTNTTSWNTEVRTWNEMGTIWTNRAIGATGFLWSIKRLPWTEATPWLTEGGVINSNKPA